MKVAELIAETELLQQKQLIQNQVKKLKITERLSKAKVRIKAYKNLELESGNEREQLQPKLLEDNWMRSIRMDDPSRVAKTEIDQERGAAITKKEQNPQYRKIWVLQDKMDGVNLPHKIAKEELEHGRYQKNTTETMREVLI